MTRNSAELPADLTAVLDKRLGRHESRTPLLELARGLFAIASLGRERPDSTDPELVALLRLLTVDSEALERGVAEFLDQVRELGLPDDAAAVVVQAYSRGVARIASAEAEIGQLLLQDVPAQEQASLLDDLLRVLLPITARGFSLLHEAMLHDALADALRKESDAEVMSVALVDLVGSTAHLLDADDGELEQLVDALFEVGQTSTSDRAVQPLKYVGDGVFLAGRESREVAAAALDALRHAERLLPLPARAGLARGRVVRRAGDVFGLPVNVAQLLTKAATPGTLLAEYCADEAFSEAASGVRRRVAVHPALGDLVATEICP